MTTAVIRINENGTLQALQIGPVEIIATLTAAKSAWGWIGGLAGINYILKGIRSPFDRDQIAKLGIHMVLLPATCYIITSTHGDLL